MKWVVALSFFRTGTFFVPIFFVSCAHFDGRPHFTAEPRTLGEILQQDVPEESRKSPLVENQEIVVSGVKLQKAQFDFPITVNAQVEGWISYFCGKGRPHFARYLERSEYFIPYIAPILKQNGLPEDLVYLSMIESGFNTLARSRAQAVGPWQFMPRIGRHYGLKVNGWVDERRDIQKSTLSAVRFLQDLYRRFKSWELVAAAYNAGETKVSRAIHRYQTDDFWVIARQNFLKPETRDYVPKIIAAAIIAKNPSQFGFSHTKSHLSEGEAIAGDGQLVHVVKTDSPWEGLAGSVSQEDLLLAKDEIFEEEVTSEVLPSFLAEPFAKPVPIPHITKNGEVGGEQLEEFEVKGPADLLKIASAAGLSYHTVKALNPELLRWCTPPHFQTYRIKLPAATRETFLAAYNHEKFSKRVKFLSYKVKRGETLAHIARRYGIKVELMSDLNRLSARSPLKGGAHIFLPLPLDRSRTLLSLDLLDPPERSNRKKYKSRWNRSLSDKRWKS
jgi:membrane-bound lytic murein transglycosylase D